MSNNKKVYTRAEKVFEYAQKAIAKANELMDKQEDELKLYAIANCIDQLKVVFQTKESAFMFTEKFLLPYWTEDSDGITCFNEQKLKEDSRQAVVTQIKNIVLTDPDLADKLENVDSVLEKFENATDFLFPYFTAMCDYATMK